MMQMSLLFWSPSLYQLRMDLPILLIGLIRSGLKNGFEYFCTTKTDCNGFRF